MLGDAHSRVNADIVLSVSVEHGIEILKPISTSVGTG